MATADLINPAPIIYERQTLDRRQRAVGVEAASEEERDPVDALEIFEHLRDIKDPEHPHSLEELNVMQEKNIQVDDAKGLVKVFFTPTVEHCSMATIIGLCIRVKLLQTLPQRFKIDIFVTPGTHSTEEAVNKQLNDKERVAAALENSDILSRMVNPCLEKTWQD
mmetsp:Transcript_26257/g.46714  ORF Transcript_26257/g.46714 Transcript_26257/m.46714 type:complete len:165 (-) Transcript_26257:451-945(-)|eukprot:CAMPEP_0177764594 /NCGR_PEP_ID=MMETSP0491_2-20121128/7487_1 /TAXON_ID=63592 /ORGANISM="Tetraselmis chuii, Strain PLY429" /LENGTH=164 /DNA_ID=CAMNT_0019280777 /DNA_START=255 /DNA_END=749 /DNA_ORIENTATION=-